MKLVHWFFEGPREAPKWAEALRWWELRRLPFNIVIGAYGVVCLLIFYWGLSTSGHLRHGDDAVEPIALLAAPIAINLLYSLGWVVEIPARLVWPDLSPRFGPTLLKMGLGLGLSLTSVPALLWGGYRVLQLGGLV